MTDLELRHLRTVRAVAEAGSISKAAVLLHISQPAMTAQLQRIERILGGPLFERGPHGTLATALGQFVLRRAEALLTDMESLVVSAQDHHGVGPRRQLRIGAVPLLMMGGFVESLRTTVPSIDTHTMIEPSAPVLIRMLSTGTADLALFERFDSMQARALDG
ncbi:MAG: LysR family transcriptional regulator, partial [Sciscionella sp.]